MWRGSTINVWTVTVLFLVLLPSGEIHFSKLSSASFIIQLILSAPFFMFPWQPTGYLGLPQPLLLSFFFVIKKSQFLLFKRCLKFGAEVTYKVFIKCRKIVGGCVFFFKKLFFILIIDWAFSINSSESSCNYIHMSNYFFIIELNCY